MKKDVIYIDVEDDITSIIEKVKASSEKIIALVPPKRNGVLQSAVNLKLLHKAAGGVNRHIVLITNDKALASLAAGVQIPVAKTLQSRPELAQVDDAPDTTEDDIINGAELPVGELAKTAQPMPKTEADEEIILPDSLIGEEPVKPVPKKSKKKTPGIPNFDSFRKKLFFGIGGLILLILFLVWATIFAPHAEVNIKAKTTGIDTVLPVTLATGTATDPAKATIKPLVQQIKKTNSADFTATGKKDVGEKASGTVTISNCSDSDPITIPSGTAVSSDGLNFFTASTVVVPGLKVKNGQCNPGQASVAVSAQDVGEQYNIKKSSIFTVAGQNSTVTASNPSAFAGGSKRQITVISDADVAAAQAKINAQDQTPVRAELSAKFNQNDAIVVTDSFTAAPGAASVTPAVGTEATSGHSTIETTYTLFAIDKNDASKVLDAFLKTKFKGEKSQKVYDTGLKALKLDKYAASEGGASIQFTTKGYIGPSIDASKIKPGLVGKNFEEIRQQIQAVDGVDDVDTTFTPFWVSSVNDEKKIDIKFSVSPQ